MNIYQFQPPSSFFSLYKRVLTRPPILPTALIQDSE